MLRSRRVADLPPLAGSAGLTQGAYGDVGNLELVSPAADGGLWVFWFNADEVEHRQGAARRCWSGGLHVFAGHEVTAARISQVASGPRFLEALALTADAELHRLYWTPTEGFVHAGVLAPDVVAASATVEAHGALHVLVVGLDATVSHLQAPLAGYPAVRWTSRSIAPRASALALGPDLSAVLVVDGQAHVLRYDDRWQPARTVPGPWRDIALAGEYVLGLDADGRFAGIEARAIAATPTTLDGGRIDVVLSVADGLVHLHGDGRSWSSPHRIRSDVWLEDGALVHRR